MALAQDDHCGCFPTGLPYPGIADLLLRAPVPLIGLAHEFDPAMEFAALPLAVIDTETTGKDPARGDRVIEIAVVHFDRGAVVARHAILVDPGVSIPAEATAIHGIANDHVRGKPKFANIARDLLALLHGRIPVAYNAGFDRTFVYAEMRKAGISPGSDRTLPPAMRTTVEWIDPLLWARATQPGAKGFKLGEVATRLGVALAQAHRATDDAEAAGNVLHAIFRDQTFGYRECIQRQREHASAWERTRGSFRR